MPSIAKIINRVFLHQTALVWLKTGDDKFGKPAYAAPVEMKCRWEDKQQEIVLPDQRKVISKGYLLMVNPVPVGSLIFLGTLVTWKAMPTYPQLPTQNQGSREVILVNTTPDIKAKSNIYENYLG